MSNRTKLARSLTKVRDEIKSKSGFRHGRSTDKQNLAASSIDKD